LTREHRRFEAEEDLSAVGEMENMNQKPHQERYPITAIQIGSNFKREPYTLQHTT